MCSTIKTFIRSYWKAFLIVGMLTAMVTVGVIYQIDAGILALFTLVAGFVTNGFVALATIVALVPWVGPLLVKIFSLPIFYLFNGLGYFLSLFAIKKGYGSEVVSYRLLTIIFLAGLVAGYIVGNLLPL